MKYFLIILSMAIFGNCSVDCPESDADGSIDPKVECIAQPAPIYHPGKFWYGKVTGLKNCIPFEASVYAHIVDDTSKFIGININTFGDWGYMLANKEIIGMGVHTDKEGTWPIILNTDTINWNYYWTFQDHDVAEDIYRMDINYQNTMTLTEINKVTNQIKGSFDCRYIVQFPSTHRQPDTLMYTDCFFNAVEQY